MRQLQKKQLLDYLRASLPEFFKKFAIPYEKQKEMAACLTPSSLVIGFARRFAPYKRATLLFADLDRLARIVGNAERPVIFVFSGKAHPADTQGIDMLQEVIRHMLDPRFFGKIFFIEDYNLAVSRLMVQGCDVWLNTPRRPYEACGTSGQKVPVNAGVNLSISDGWWCEGYNGENGWTIGPAVTREYLCGEQSDYDDAGFLYALLEEKIVPLYFERNFEGMPHDWLLTVRQSMQSLIARFSSNRMVREYLNDYYIPAAQRYAELRDKHNALTKRLARWKQDVNARFSSLRIEQIRIEGLKGEELMGTQPMQVQIGVLPGRDEARGAACAARGPDRATATVLRTLRTSWIWRARRRARRTGSCTPVPTARPGAGRMSTACECFPSHRGWPRRWRRGWSCGDKPDLFGTGLWKGYFGTPLSSAGALNAPGVVYATGAR